MPVPALLALARRTGRSAATAESIWDAEKAKIHPRKRANRGKHSYRYLMGTVKHIMENKAKSRD